MRFLGLAGLAILASGSAFAQEAGDWYMRAGPYLVAPKSDNGDVVEVDDGYALGFTVNYRFTENWALEILAATPFSHDINLDGGPEVGETKHLPPTVSIQYHWTNFQKFRPYVGAGVNYTLFFDEDTTGPLTGVDLDLDGSFGLAAQIGADWDLNDNWFLNFDLRWIDIDTDAELNTDPTTEFDVEIDPIVVGFNVGYRW